MNQRSHSDNGFIAMLLATAVSATIIPYLAIFHNIAGWPADAPMPGFVSILALIAVSYWIRRLTTLIEEDNVSVLLGFITLLVSIRLIYYPGQHWSSLVWIIDYLESIVTFGYLLPATVILGLPLYIGVIIYNDGTDHYSTSSLLTRCLFALIFVTFISFLPILRPTEVQSQFTFSILVFFASALCALPLSKMETLHHSSPQIATRATGSWLLLASGIGLALLLTGTLIATAIDIRIPSLIVLILSTIWGIVAVGLQLLLYPLSLAVAGLYWIGKKITDRFDPRFAQLEEVPLGEWTEPVDIALKETLQGVDLTVAAGVVAAIITCILLGRLLRQRAPRHGRQLQLSFTESRTSSFAKQFTSDKERALTVDDLLTEHSHAAQEAVRQSFFRVISWIEHHSLPVRRSDTPAQYIERLRPYLSHQQLNALSKLIDLYLPARYGRYIPTQTDIATASQLATELTDDEPLTVSSNVGDDQSQQDGHERNDSQ